MFIVTDKTTGITISFEGAVNRIPTKIGANEVETNLGARKQEHVRAVVDLSIRIDNIPSEDYDNLEKIFMVSNNSLDIEDTDRGKYYSNYYISGTTLQLEEHEDTQNNTYYYMGGIQLAKR